MVKEYVPMPKLAKMIQKPIESDKVLVYHSSENKTKVMGPKTTNNKRKYTLDQIGDTLTKLVDRIDRIDARLDYVIKANDLKDLPTQK